MILSDREVRLAIARDAIRIVPEPTAAAWSSTAVDLTLAGPLSCWRVPRGRKGPPLICPFAPDYDFTALTGQFSQEVELTEAGFVVEPLSFVLGWTAEWVRLPHASRIAARVEGKSSLARLGLGVHVTAPTIHAGFGAAEGAQPPGSSIRLEIWNIGPFRVKLERGMPVCQLIFEWVDGTPEKGYAGQFRIQGPGAASPPK